MLTGLARRGYDVYAITYDLSGPQPKLLPIEQEGVKVFRSDYYTLSKSFNLSASAPGWVYKQNALKYLKKYISGGDILFTCFTPEKEAWELAKAVNAKVIQKYTIVVGGGWKEDDWPVDYHIFNSHACERGMREVANISGPSTVIYPEIDIEHENLWDPNGAIGMVNPALHKGVHIFHDLCRSFPEEHFEACGGWAVSNIVTGPKNFHYIPHIENMRDFYKRLKILLCPTQDEHFETFGRVIVEAMKYGIPVMASEKDGIPEAVACRGMLVPHYDDPREWAKRLKKILRPATLGSYNSSAISRAWEYKLSDIMDQWVYVINRLGC